MSVPTPSRTRSAMLVAALAVAVAVPAVHGAAAQDPVTARPTPSPTGPPTTPGESAPAIPAHLPGELAATLARFPDLTGSGRVAITVLDRAGTPVWSHDGEVGLLPASTMKSLTASSVLAVFGPDGTIPTSVSAPGPVSADGTVNGSLVLRGYGDPTLTSDDYRRWVYPARPSSAIEDLADAVVAAGVQRVTGGLTGDGTRFSSSSTAAAGWPARYFGDFDAHNLSALTIDAGRRVEVSERGPVSVTIRQHPDPSFRAAALLARALAERGVVIEGRVTSRIRPATSSLPIARVTSPPMRDVLTFMLQESDNHLADQLVRAAALRATGDGSWEAAGDGIRTALGDLDVATTGFVLADGSGLSRNNRVSADLLARNDRAQYDRWGSQWSAMLPVAGESGTLANRLVGTSGQGRLIAKTGTLDDVRGLAGHVTGAGEDRYHFALLVNGVSEGIRWQASVLGDEIALVLTDALDGCRRVRTDAGAGRELTATPTRPGSNLGSGEWERRCTD